MKGSTSLRRFCWLQVDFSYGHCPVAHFDVSNGMNWSVAGAAVIEIVATLLTVKLLAPMSGLERAVPEVA
jgi:hypothetical protein